MAPAVAPSQVYDMAHQEDVVLGPAEETQVETLVSAVLRMERERQQKTQTGDFRTESLVVLQANLASVNEEIEQLMEELGKRKVLFIEINTRTVLCACVRQLWMEARSPQRMWYNVNDGERTCTA